MIGRRIASYEVQALLGKGGMGEVYRAHDTRLGQDVAIKILPTEFSEDPDRVARFEREARVLASLNHPNIAMLFGLEEEGGLVALVLELVEGPTLADRIARGRLLPAEARLAVRTSRRRSGARDVGRVLCGHWRSAILAVRRHDRATRPGVHLLRVAVGCAVT